jgi:hypothetical protein
MAPEEGAIHLIKLNTVDPQAYLTATLTAIVNGHKQSQIDGLLPWNYPTAQYFYSPDAGTDGRLSSQAS